VIRLYKPFTNLKGGGGGQKKRRKRTGKRREKKGEERKKKESRTPLSKAEKHRGRGVNSTSIARFHCYLPHHLHGEHQQKERKGTEIINRVAIVFIVPEAVTTGCAQKLRYRCLHPSQLPERETKKTQKTGQRRRKGGRKRRKNEKEKRNHKPVGTAF